MPIASRSNRAPRKLPQSRTTPEFTRWTTVATTSASLAALSETAFTRSSNVNWSAIFPPVLSLLSMDRSKFDANTLGGRFSVRTAVFTCPGPFICIIGVHSDCTVFAGRQPEAVHRNEHDACRCAGTSSGYDPVRDGAEGTALLLLLLREGFGRWLGVRADDGLAHVLAPVVVDGRTDADVHREPLASLAAIDPADGSDLAIIA